MLSLKKRKLENDKYYLEAGHNTNVAVHREKPKYAVIPTSIKPPYSTWYSNNFTQRILKHSASMERHNTRTVKFLLEWYISPTCLFHVHPSPFSKGGY
jgi:hypothetical protein